jgi:hypothetical protein
MIFARFWYFLKLKQAAGTFCTEGRLTHGLWPLGPESPRRHPRWTRSTWSAEPVAHIGPTARTPAGTTATTHARVQARDATDAKRGAALLRMGGAGGPNGHRAQRRWPPEQRRPAFLDEAVNQRGRGKEKRSGRTVSTPWLQWRHQTWPRRPDGDAIVVGMLQTWRRRGARFRQLWASRLDWLEEEDARVTAELQGFSLKPGEARYGGAELRVELGFRHAQERKRKWRRGWGRGAQRRGGLIVSRAERRWRASPREIGRRGALPPSSFTVWR